MPSPGIDAIFSRALLTKAHEAVKAAFPEVNLREDAWVYHAGRGSWEFHGPARFYWNGRAGNAYDARYKGWMAYLKSKGIEH